jgi:nucleoside-diphosphate-sugar epimerase
MWWNRLRLCILGGSGFLGINLIRHLFAKGLTDVRSLDLVEFDYPEKGRVDAVVGDAQVPSLLTISTIIGRP